jgi:membrane protein
MVNNAWILLRETVTSFVKDEALSRGASIAFYAVTSLAPLLFITIAIAGLVFGRDAAQGAIVAQLGGMMGQQSADLLQDVIRGASDSTAGVFAAVAGIVTLILTASGVFGEIQSALNAFWRVEEDSILDHKENLSTTISNLVRARAASIGLVAALGFLLIVSLAVSAGLTALGDYINAQLPFGETILGTLNFLISFALLTALFAAIYKVLPDRPLAWGDVSVGALATALLFTLGKTLIGLYIGSSAVASSYGAAGALIIVLLWVYYSAQIFLLGAEFTKVYARHFGSMRARRGSAKLAPDTKAADARASV